MNYIKRLHIEGFKKFSRLDIEFNEYLNILVGENEAGKSTILDAIKTVLNQQYRTADKSILKDLFNVKDVEKFENNPSEENLPKIIIELELDLDPNIRGNINFHGEVYGQMKQQEEASGIRFECRYDPDLGAELSDFIQSKSIPYDYYSLKWTTFANTSYQSIQKPLRFLSIDTSHQNASTSFNYYNKTLFLSRYQEETRCKAKASFRLGLDEAFGRIQLDELEEDRKFGIDHKKVILENIISVFDKSVPLENRGSGMENLIKTRIALDKKSGLEVILMEEPENHLSSSNLHKMLHEIKSQEHNAQIIVATHSNMIASRLQLSNVLWISEEKVISLKNVDSDVSDFFMRADDNSFLQLLLAKKTILVEGPTEYLLVPSLYKKIIGRSIEEDEVTIISCNGLSYRRYLDIAETANKKVAVITDNDGEQNKIDRACKFNRKHDLQHIFMNPSLDEWTWEIGLYNKNKRLLDSFVQLEPNADYPTKIKIKNAVVRKMINNKVSTAYGLLKEKTDLTPPDYVKEAVEWLNK